MQEEAEEAVPVDRGANVFGPPRVYSKTQGTLFALPGEGTGFGPQELLDRVRGILLLWVGQEIRRLGGSALLATPSRAEALGFLNVGMQDVEDATETLARMLAANATPDQAAVPFVQRIRDIIHFLGTIAGSQASDAETSDPEKHPRVVRQLGGVVQRLDEIRAQDRPVSIEEVMDILKLLNELSLD